MQFYKGTIILHNQTLTTACILVNIKGRKRYFDAMQQHLYNCVLYKVKFNKISTILLFNMN